MKIFSFFLLASLLYLDFSTAAQHHFKLYCFYTPDYISLLEDYFLPSLKDDFDLVIREFPQECPSGTFRSSGWDQTMYRKLELLEEAILENWDNQVFFYSDIDIAFLKPILEISLAHLGDSDFAAQQSWPRDTICAGFFIMRGNYKTLQLISQAKQLLKNQMTVDDQLAIQQLLNQTMKGDISWKLLPSEQYPNGRRVLKSNTGYYSKESEIAIPNDMILFHATSTIGLENKCHFIKRIQEEVLK